MPPITIYTKAFCPYCVAAKALLKSKNAPFTEIRVDRDSAAQSAMAARAGGRRTVPQIFFGDRHIGGCEDIEALEEIGELDPLLAADR
ncbi:MAG TPA: glutaredoxin 3 [Roseiarcus sp.]|nr:glutaredoxin 3 [Roseiarcus sp.]